MTEKRVMVDMSVTLLHHGHVRLLKKAKELGYVIVALTTDEEIIKHKGYRPELNFEQRKEILLALKYVDEVVACNWLIEEDFLKQHRADMLVHSGENPNPVKAVYHLPRTEGISTTELRQKAVSAIVEQRNSHRCLLTPGPTNLHPQSIFDLQPVFTRGDAQYDALEKNVLNRILPLAGQDSIVAMQGSATTAIEIATSNFLTGDVCVVLSGYYSSRMLKMLEVKKEMLGLSNLRFIDYEEVIKGGLSGQKLDWVVAAYTETADAFLVDMKLLRQVSDTCKARLMIDATGSINLESNHDLADVCMFSSCKGLGGLAGAGFISYNRRDLERLNNRPKPFMLDLQTHLQKMTTAAVHALSSLNSISADFAALQERVQVSKQAFMDKFSAHTKVGNQPLLCTKLRGVRLRFPEYVLTYQPRTASPDTQVICHLFDQFSSNRQPGELYDLCQE